jgi:hypothetical protein
MMVAVLLGSEAGTMAGRGGSPEPICECGSVALQRRGQLRDRPVDPGGWRSLDALTTARKTTRDAKTILDR